MDSSFPSLQQAESLGRRGDNRRIRVAAFALAENTSAFLPVFRNALIRRGLPTRLYVDNGSAYRSRYLALVCARLGVALIHARAFQPAGKGKIERFRTVRAGWLAHLDAPVMDSIEMLNRSLWAWIEGEYHPASWPGGAHPARAVGAGLGRGPLPGRHAGPRRPVPLRGQAAGLQGPHRQPERAPLRGRSPAGRREGHPALRPRGTALAAPGGGP